MNVSFYYHSKIIKGILEYFPGKLQKKCEWGLGTLKKISELKNKYCNVIDSPFNAFYKSGPLKPFTKHSTPLKLTSLPTN